jgi:hypothetical protein
MLLIITRALFKVIILAVLGVARGISKIELKQKAFNFKLHRENT